LFFSLVETKADEKMVASLDHNNYNENDLVQLKFALNIPYIQNNSSYERCDGEVEYNGVQYNYVKRLVKSDTLYLYCIPNKEKTGICNAQNLYAKQNADNTSGKSTEKSLKKVNFLSDYNLGAISLNFRMHQIQSAQSISFNNLTTLKGFTTKHLQPPDLFI
jgi:hypothetical protein